MNVERKRKNGIRPHRAVRNWKNKTSWQGCQKKGGEKIGNCLRCVEQKRRKKGKKCGKWLVAI